MTAPLVLTLITAGSAFAGSLLGTFVTPLVQHRVWKRQRLLDLRLAVIDDVRDLTTDYIIQYSATNHSPFAERYRPPAEFSQLLSTTAEKVSHRFSDETIATFQRLVEMIPLPPDKQNMLGMKEFRSAQRAVLQAMQQELRLI
jgi:hypothetical protein